MIIIFNIYFCLSNFNLFLPYQINNNTMKVYSEIQLNQSNRYGEIAPKVYNVVHIEMQLGEDTIMVPFKYRWSDELGEYYHRMGVPECSFDMYLDIKAHLYDLLQEQYPSIFNEVFNANR